MLKNFNDVFLSCAFLGGESLVETGREDATTQNEGNNPVNVEKSEDVCYEEVEE